MDVYRVLGTNCKYHRALRARTVEIYIIEISTSNIT